MSEPYIGEIQIFGFNFAPRNWAQCAGQLLPISQNTALFSLLGTQYGGDGRVTFALPNLQDNAACNQGQGLGLTARTIGEAFGEPNVTLTDPEMPQHQHALTVFAQNDTSKRSSSPAAGYGLASPASSQAFAPNGSNLTGFAPGLIGTAGGGLPHSNQQPYLAMNFCIALQGIFPSFG